MSDGSGDQLSVPAPAVFGKPVSFGFSARDGKVVIVPPSRAASLEPGAEVQRFQRAVNHALNLAEEAAKRQRDESAPPGKTP